MFFHYRAIKNNAVSEGKIESGSRDGVIQYLKENNYFIIEVKEAGQSFSSLSSGFLQHVGFTDIVNLTRQLSIMLNAGLTLIDSFDILIKQTTKPAILAVVQEIDKEIKGGKPFSYALAKFPRHFSSLYISLVRSGEASGKLSEILMKLADNLEKQREFQGKIKGALIYPAIVVVGMVGVMFVMITFVMPKLLAMYKDFNVELPMSTKILIAVSNVTSKFWPIILGLVFAGVTALKSYFNTKPGRLIYDKTMLKLPVVSDVIQMSNLVDSTRTLAILINSGVSILESLNIIIETSTNLIFQQAFKNIYKQIEKGVSLGAAMANEKVFPPILIQMTIVGEQTGHLDETLLRISNYFEMESNMAIKAMTTLIEPAILIVLGVGVGFLVISVITPIYNLTNSFK